MCGNAGDLHGARRIRTADLLGAIAMSPEHACLQRFSDVLGKAAGSEICRDMNRYAASQALLAKSALNSGGRLETAQKAAKSAKTKIYFVYA
jgi:hypothetical protein